MFQEEGANGQNCDNSSSNYGSMLPYSPLNVNTTFGGYDDDDELIVYEARTRRKLTIEDINRETVMDYLSIVCNSLNALLGVSLFVMPWAFLQSGALFGLIMLLVIAILSYETARIFLMAQKYFYQSSGDIFSYHDIAAAAIGPNRKDSFSDILSWWLYRISYIPSRDSLSPVHSTTLQYNQMVNMMYMMEVVCMKIFHLVPVRGIGS
jgi:hypothetical protein